MARLALCALAAALLASGASASADASKTAPRLSALHKLQADGSDIPQQQPDIRNRRALQQVGEAGEAGEAIRLLSTGVGEAVRRDGLGVERVGEAIVGFGDRIIGAGEAGEAAGKNRRSSSRRRN